MERAELTNLLQGTPTGGGSTHAVVVGSSKPAVFMEQFRTAVAGEALVFLNDPTWSRAQHEAAHEQYLEACAVGSAAMNRGWLLLPTGGTSGGVRFARHDQDTIAAAVGGFCAHFGLRRVNAVGVLPLQHVSGLMAWMRTVWTGGTFVPWSWRELQEGRRPGGTMGDDWVISLVPTQLQRLLEIPVMVEWLRSFRIIFLGGGPPWAALLDAAANAKLNLSLSYGMTETAAMVAALRPEEFLAGDRSSGEALPHARLSTDAAGLIHIAGESVFRGYWPEWRDAQVITTEDLGSRDARGHWRVLGRRDAVIITGGKKVHPAEVEAALRASGEFEDVAVIGVADPEWGEVVVACYPQQERVPDTTRAGEALAPQQRPKRFVAIAADEWPRNAQGKVNRLELKRRAELPFR